MLKVGLTGGIASGKSTVTELFSGYGITVIDADVIAKQLTAAEQPLLAKIIELFGHDFLLPDGELDRKKCRDKIFSDQSAKQQLEHILHPAIRAEMSHQAALSQSTYTILAIPLLVEADFVDLVDRVLVVDIANEAQLQRLCDRDNIDITLAKRIVASQIDNQQRLQFADDVIDNNASVLSLAGQVKKLHKLYEFAANGC
jgi:dephospho-CoA kinase